MSNPSQNDFQPDAVPPPGETIQDALEELGMTQNEFAIRMGLTPKHVSALVNGKGPITPGVALSLESVLGVPARFWLNLDANYQEFLSRKQQAVALESQLAWVKAFPVLEMIKLKWMPECQPGIPRLQAVLRFFGVAEAAAWESIWGRPEAVFRASGKKTISKESLSAWLRFGQTQAQGFDGPEYDAVKFEVSLRSIRKFVGAAPAEFLPQLQAACRSAGVAFYVVPELPKLAVSGACFWLADRPVILLNLYSKSEDNFWFSFFHEAKHVLQGVKKRLFVDAPGDALDDPKEMEADRYAKEILIPAERWNSFVQAAKFGRAQIEAFAKAVKVSPGIVVGHLQHHGLVPWASPLTKLKTRFEWA